MTNKPMLSVELRAGLERLLENGYAQYLTKIDAVELRVLLDKPACETCHDQGEVFVSKGKFEYGAETEPDPIYKACPDCSNTAAQHQGEPVEKSEFEPDAICLESDGCPTEGAVLKRFWRENQPDPVLCEFYEAEDFPSLVRELVGHVAQLQEAAKRNVKPWEDTFPPTLLPAYIARINAEQPAPVADHTQCEECKGWGYHENHYDGGGTECGECGGSGNASVAVFMPDVDELAQIIRKVDGSHNLGAGSLAEAIPEEVARLNGLKP